MLANCTIAVPASTLKPNAEPAPTVLANVMLLFPVASKVAPAVNVTAPVYV